MVNIDYIMDLLDWNKSKEEQEYGIALAKKVKCINVFFQPSYPFDKNVWDNCAQILSERTNDELMPYLYNLMIWLQDLNWPGAICILNRLKKYPRNSTFKCILDICIDEAQKLNNDIWLNNLLMITESSEINNKLSKEK